jgi:hypothetical protein
MALPNIQNNSTEIVDVLQTSMDINLDIFSFLEKYAEKQVKILQEILTVIKKQYEFNVDWRRDEEYQREEIDRENQKPNPPETPEPSDPKPSAGGFSLSGALAAALASLFASIKKSIESVITKLKSVFKPFESVITKLKSAFRPVISAFESVITKLKSVFKPIISAFKSVFTVLKSVFKPIISSFETVFTVFKNILKFFGRFNLFGLIIFGIIDFITGFIDKFKAADSFGEGILEGLWGGFTNVIRGFVAIPLDLLKDLLSWIAEKLGFSEVAKILDSFSFVDLFNKATEWYYNTETDTWFGGVFDNLPEKMKALYTDLKTKLESFIKDYIYDGSGDRIKVFGQELPNMTDISNFGTEMKIKLTEFVKNNIYDGSGDRIKVFGQELPNMTDIANFGTEIKTKLTEFIKDYIYDGSGDKIKLFGQELPNMTDIANFGTEIKTKLESFIKDYIYDGSGDKIKLFGQELPNMTDIIQFGTEIKTKLTEFIKDYIYDDSDGIEIFGVNFTKLFDEINKMIPSIDEITDKFLKHIPDLLLNDEQKNRKDNLIREETNLESKREAERTGLEAHEAALRKTQQTETKQNTIEEYNTKYKEMNVNQLNTIIASGKVLGIERQFVNDLLTLKSKENTARYVTQKERFIKTYGVDPVVLSETKIIPSTTAPVTGAAVESGSQAVNEINSQAPIVNVVSDSSSKVNAPVTSTVVNYTPGSSNARNSDNSVRQFSINALSGL